MTFQELLQDLVNKSEGEKVAIAASSYTDLRPLFNVIDKEHNGLGVAFTILGSAIGADGKLTAGEFAFVASILHAEGQDVSFEQAEEMITRYASDGRSYEVTQALSNALNSKPDYKASLITLVAAICALDDRIDSNEFAFLQTLL